MSRPRAVCAALQEGRGAGGVGASLGTVGGRADARTPTSSRTGVGDPRPDPGPETLVRIWAGDPRPWAVGPSCQDDPLRDPASLSAQ